MLVKKLAIFLFLFVLAFSVESSFAATSCLSILDRQKRVLTTSADKPYVISGPLYIYLKANCSIPKKTNNNPKPKAVIEVDQDGVTVDKIKIEYYVVFNNRPVNSRQSYTEELWFLIDDDAFEYENRYQTAPYLKPMIFNSLTEDAKIIFSINKSYVGENANVLDEIVFFVTHGSISTPTISISGDGAVTEGTDATFTLMASPAPAGPITVPVTVTQTGNFAVSGTTGSKTVTLSTSGSATYTVSTVDDDTDEPDGAVTVTVGTGQGYTVASVSSAMVAVRDNDDPPPVTPAVDNDYSVPSGGTSQMPMPVTPAVDNDDAMPTGGWEREEICDVPSLASRSTRGFVECAADSIGDSQSFGETLGLLEEFRDGSTYPVVVLLTERGGVYFHSRDREVEDRNWFEALEAVSCTGSGSVLELEEGIGCSIEGGGYAHKFSASRVPLAHDQDFVLLGGFDETPEGKSFPTEGIVGVPSPRAGEVDTDDELRDFVEEVERALGEAFGEKTDPAQLRGILRTSPWREGNVRVYILDEMGRWVIFDGGDRGREQRNESANVRDLIDGAGQRVVQYREDGSLVRGYAIRVEEGGGVYIVGSGYGVEQPGDSGGGCAVGGSGGGASSLFPVLALLLAVLLERRSAEDRTH